MVFYRRNLPHWIPEGKTLFITWRLHGSLPWKSHATDAKRGKIPGDEQFKKMDGILDRAESGPVWLKDPRIAECVVSRIHKGHDLRHYDLHAYVVMPNHMHVLLTPRIEARQLMKSLKGATARAANKILRRVGKPFWQDESFDRWVRNELEFTETRTYIEHNPVTARLVESPEDWPWSSAARSS